MTRDNEAVSLRRSFDDRSDDDRKQKKAAEAASCARRNVLVLSAWITRNIENARSAAAERLSISNLQQFTNRTNIRLHERKNPIRSRGLFWQEFSGALSLSLSFSLFLRFLFSLPYLVRGKSESRGNKIESRARLSMLLACRYSRPSGAAVKQPLRLARDPLSSIAESNADPASPWRIVQSNFPAMHDAAARIARTRVDKSQPWPTFPRDRRARCDYSHTRGGVRFWRDFHRRETALLRVESASRRAKSTCHGRLGKRNERGDYREIDRDVRLRRASVPSIIRWHSDNFASRDRG